MLHNVRHLNFKFENVVVFVGLMTLVTLTLTIILSTTSNKFFQFNDSKHANALDTPSLVHFNFAAVGDWGCNSNTKNTVNNIIDKDPELVLGLGDYAYRNNAQCWLELVDPIDNKMKIAIGNHDTTAVINKTSVPAPTRLQEYMNHFNLSRQYYSFDHENVHFIAISTEVPFEVGSKQYDFVASDLKEAASDPNIKWTIIFHHRLAYTSSTSAGHLSLKNLTKSYHPLFEKYGVDIVIQAHSHNYQRSYPIKFNAENLSNPLITDKNTTNYYDPEGQIFTVVGTGGATAIHNFTGPPTKYVANQFNAFGFLNLAVANNGTKLSGEFHDNDGTIKDRFTITKLKKAEKKLFLPSDYQPKINSGYNNKFKIESIFNGLDSPTDMAFLGPEDILVLEKNNGKVQRIVNGGVLEKPLLDVTVSNKFERGLLGIAIPKSMNGTQYVFLYYTESKEEGDDVCSKSNYCNPGTEPQGNRLYRYELAENKTKLINPKLLLDLPAVPGPGHNGGKMTTGSENDIFLVIGDLMGHTTRAQNYEDGDKPDATGSVLRFNQEGQPLNNGYFGDEYPLNLYYAYGIRNSFGIDFDPVAGNLWDSENGPDFGDEINLISPGFNSGWKDVQGIWERKGGKPLNVSLHPDKLANFNGKGKYSEPEFTFFDTVGVTAIKFFDSNKFGLEYRNDLFVGDIKNGNIYHFGLDEDRQSLVLDGFLSDKIANTPDELDKVKFADGFSGITDLEVGPDGYLYVLAYGEGTIYRIVPN